MNYIQLGKEFIELENRIIGNIQNEMQKVCEKQRLLDSGAVGELKS